MFEPKLPFGIEFEFTDRLQEGPLEEAITIALQPFGHELVRSESPDTWTFKTDSTCGWEFTTPILKGLEALVELGTIMKSIQSRFVGRNLVDQRCGIHVHLGVEDVTRRQLKTLFLTFQKIEPFLFKMVPNSRGRSSYCESLGHYRYEDEDDGYFPTDHSTAVNLADWSHRGSLEVRYAPGSCNERKVTGWISLIQGVIRKALDDGAPGNEISNLETFLSWIGEGDETDWDRKVVAWIKDRYGELRNPEDRRGAYRAAKEFRDRMDHVHQSWHFRQREEMNRDQKREHDNQMVEWASQGDDMLDHPIPEDFRNDFYRRNPSRAPEDWVDPEAPDEEGPEGDVEAATVEEVRETADAPQE